MATKQGKPKATQRINIHIDNGLFDEALFEALHQAEGKGAGLTNLLRIHTRRTRVLSLPTHPLSERPRTIGMRLRRTFVFEV